MIEHDPSYSQLEPLADASSYAPELVSNPELSGIAGLLQERGETVEPGTEVMPTLFADGKEYNTVRFVGFESSLPNGQSARFTVRAVEIGPDEKARDRLQKSEAFIPAHDLERHRAWVLEKNSSHGILVVNSYTDTVDGKPVQRENAVMYQLRDRGEHPFLIRWIEPSKSALPDALTNLSVTEEKLAGRQITLSEVPSAEGDIVRTNTVDARDKVAGQGKYAPGRRNKAAAFLGKLRKV